MAFLKFTNPKSSKSKLAELYPYLLLSIAGFSFFFFIAFPFANHNESYIWVAELTQMNIKDAFTHKIISVESFRPLGQLTAWLTYHITNHIFLQQLLNWSFASLSFIFLFAASENKAYFSVISFLICAGFFTGYIYLFHLHGVFYGPLQLYIALVTIIAAQRSLLSSRGLIILWLLTLIVGLYHTFALATFCFFLLGYCIEVNKKLFRKQLYLIVILFVLSLLMIKLLITSNQVLGLDHTQGLAAIFKNPTFGFATSFEAVEINKPLLMLSAILALLTVISFKTGRKEKLLSIGVLLVSVSLFIYFHIPVILLWLGACVIKLMINKYWALAAVLLSTITYPLANPTGSPTYTVFSIMICAFVSSMDVPLKRFPASLGKRVVVVFLILLLILMLSTRLDIKLPLLSRLTQPLLAEKEKTFQLEDIVKWRDNSSYSQYGLTFFNQTNGLISSKYSLKRQNRPPTNQTDLNEFFKLEQYIRPLPKDNSQTLLVTFGNETLANYHLIYSVKGTWNGNANVYIK